MSSPDQRTLAANLLLERVELKRDIAHLKADLTKRADVFVKLGNLLRSSPQVVSLDDQELPPDRPHALRSFRLTTSIPNA